MKRIFTIVAALVMTTNLWAQAPEKMSYQAVVRDASNTLVTTQAVGMQLSILQGSTTGTAVYVETQTPTSNANGLVTLEIGTGTIVSGVFTTIDWSNGPYFIKTESDPTGGTTYTITGTSQLLSVPYALHAKTAESVSGSITEADPIFGASVASGITGIDTTYWNNKLDSYTETDPIFGASVASGITGIDTTYWNNKLDSYTETDPIFGASVASGITGIDTTYWNNKLDSYTETDPIFGASVASGITGIDTTYWNNKLDSTSLIWQNTGNDIYYDNGNIGIGTTNPIAKLHISDTLPVNQSSSMFLLIESGNQQDSIYRGIYSKINGTAGYNRALQGVSDGYNSQYNFGVIGFGLNATVNRGITGVSNSTNNNTNGFNYGVFGFANQSEFSNIAVGAYADLGNTTSGANYGVSASATSITSGVNYGIYSTASNGGTNYAGFFNGDVTITGTLTSPSDAKLKSNIKQLNNAMPLIRQLNPVEYDYKKEFSGKKLNLPQNHQYGFIAQEIQTILPELVSNQKINIGAIGDGNIDGVDNNSNNSVDKSHSPESIDFIGVNYISIIPILVQGIKEQDTKINELEFLILELKKQVEELKKQ